MRTIPTLVHRAPRNRLYLTTCLATALLSVPLMSPAQEVILESEADVYIMGSNTPFDNNFGHADGLNVKYYHTGNFRGDSRKTYVRFNLSEIGDGTVTSARFELAFSSAHSATFDFNVFALNYGHPGAEWVEGTGEENVRPPEYTGETPPDPITWRNAPGNDLFNGGGHPDDTETGGDPDTAAGLVTDEVTFIDTFSVTVGDGMPQPGAWLGLVESNQNLVDYLNARGENDRITLILTLRDVQNSNFVFVSSRNETHPPPRLALTVDDGDLPPSPFDDWRAVHFDSAELDDPAISGEEANPSGDGIVNLLKYAFDLNPKAISSRDELPVPAVTGDRLTLEFTRVKAATDIAYIAEVSGNLETWNSGPGFVEQTGTIDHGETETVTVRDAEQLPEPPARRFMRVRVERQ